MSKYILISDMDDTLTGDVEGISEFNRVVKSNRASFYLVYSSGRYKESMINLIRKEKLILPNVIISNVGTEIYYAPDWKVDEEWEKMLEKSWKRQRPKIISILDKANLERQPYDKNFVLAYYVKNSEVVDEVKEKLKEFNVKIIWTKGENLDVIPDKAGKGSAADFLKDKLNLPVICCGDSENDIDMLEKCNYGVLVGNASKHLKDRFLRDENTYISDSHHAKGVIEGLKHFSVI